MIPVFVNVTLEDFHDFFFASVTLEDLYDTCVCQCYTGGFV